MEYQQTTINISKESLKKFGILAVEEEVSRKKIIELCVDEAANNKEFLNKVVNKIKKPR